MYIFYTRYPDYAVVNVEGSVEGYVQDAFSKPFEELAQIGCSKIILDMEKVQFISSLIIGSIIEHWRIARERKGELIICNPSARVRELMSITNLILRIRVAESEEDARALLVKGGKQ